MINYKGLKYEVSVNGERQLFYEFSHYIPLASYPERSSSQRNNGHMSQPLSKPGVAISSLEASVRFKWRAADTTQLDIPAWARPEYERVQRNKPSLLNPRLSRGMWRENIHGA